MLGKILAASLTLSIGGSGGVFAPSLFIGAMAGMAFGTVAHDVFGPAIGPPAIYAVVAMGGVFAAASQAPLTAIASVAEMTANFTLTLPDHARLRDRRGGLQAPQLRQHLHHQAAAPRHRHRAAKGGHRAADADRRRRNAAAGLHLNGHSQLLSTASSAAATAARVADARWESVAGRSTDIAPAPGALRRGDTRTGAATARPLRPRRAAGALPRRPAPARLDHPPERARRARRERKRLRGARSSTARSPPTSPPSIPQHSPTHPAHRSGATRSSRSTSHPGLPRSAAASTKSTGHPAASSSPSPRATRSSPSQQHRDPHRRANHPPRTSRRAARSKLRSYAQVAFSHVS